LPDSIGETVESILTVKATLDYRIAEEGFAGAALRRFGRVAATRLPAVPDVAAYNKARGFSLDDRDRFAEITAFYEETGQRPRLEVWAEDESPELRRWLTTNRLTRTTIAVTLHAHTGVEPPAPPAEVIVDEVDHDDSDYVDLLIRGYGMERASAEARRVLVLEHSTPGLRRYLATVDGVPAAAAALFTDNGQSLFVGAGTLPDFRRRGCQAALISRRLADARLTSDTVVVTAADGSPSSVNLKRHGFQLTHTRAIWQ
jgi:ribosomal protein S18 acetylase RimI-like enzyme